MDGHDRKPGSGWAGQKAGRAERLAAALRDNLHRRKAQARARRSTDAAAEDPGDGQPKADDKSGNTG